MKAKRAFAVVAAATILTTGLALGSPTARADCNNTMVWGNGGGQCDGPYYSDGSFQRCVTVWVLGIGGTNCYIVPPPPP